MRKCTTLILILGIPALAGCLVEDVEEPQSLVLEGMFSPTAPDLSVSGGAAVISRGTGTEITVEIGGLDPNREYPWHIREGPCEGTGDPIVDPSSFVTLTTDDAGQAALEPGMAPEGQPALGITLDPDPDYAAEVFSDEDEDAPDIPEDGVLACADLTSPR